MSNPASYTTQESLTIIAIGASAGGLEALQDFLSNLPILEKSAIIVAQHLSPTHKSMLVHLLSKETLLTVEEAKSGLKLVPNKVYITPPDKEITISRELKIILQKPSFPIGPKPSVDVLFDSLKNIPLENPVVGIILSGTGSDGAKGIQALKSRHSFVMAQNPETAKYDGMPSSAINTELVDAVVETAEMGPLIRQFVQQPNDIPKKVEIEEIKADQNSISKILKLLGKRTGTDFSNYKSATISRRLEKRMSILKIHEMDDYLALVEKQPHELDEMFNMILIGVTTFFRDTDAFEALEMQLREKLASKKPKDFIRIWVPGCSTGEEAYSLAIILAKILQNKMHLYNIQIFATDIDDRAITIARRGIYSEESIKPIPQELQERYFVRKGKEFELVKAIRAMVLFSKHDVINNPPFLKLDLISCRNLLIYFNNVLQQQVMPIFHYSLNPEGVLFLGKSETIGQFTDLFGTIDAKNKIFKRKRGGNIRQVKFATFKANLQERPRETTIIGKKPVSIAEAIRETIFKTFEYPYVVINESYDIQEVNGDVRLFMSLTSGSIQVNLLKMVNPELQIELRAVLAKAFKEKSSFSSKIKKFNLFGKDHFVRLLVQPLINAEIYEDLYLIIFQKLEIEEFIQNTSLSDEQSLISARIIELEHELTATKEHLQTYIEEIETANEELQSLNEEMQSTNEELQSSNEELETSNEELQSTNEEVHIAYGELKVAHEELETKELLLMESQANARALLSNNQQGLVLLDPSYRVLKFNKKAVELVNLFKKKKINVSDSFFDFLPTGQVESFLESFNACLQGKIIQKEKSIKDVNGIVRSFSFNMTPVFLNENEVKGISIGILETTELLQALSELSASEKLINAVFNASTTGICITDAKGRFVDINNAYCEIYGYSREELIGQNFTMVVPPRLRSFMEKMHDDFIENGKEIPGEFEVINKKGQLIKVATSADLLVQPNGERFKVTSVRDVTQEKNLHLLVDDALQMSQLGAWEAHVETGQLQVTRLFHEILAFPKNKELNFMDFIQFFKSYHEQNKLVAMYEQCVKKGDPFDFDGQISSADHEDKWIRIIGRAERSDERTIRVYGSIQDITTSKLLELQVTSINKNMPGALIRYSMLPSGERKILYLSEGASKLWEIHAEEILQNNDLLWHQLDPTEAQKIEDSFVQSAKDMSKWSETWTFVRRSGEVTWQKGTGYPFQDENGNVIWDIVILDVTEEVIAKRALEETEKRFEFLFDQVESLSVQGYDTDGKVRFWNKASEKIYGYTKEEALGKYLWDLIIPEEAIPQVKNDVYQMIKSGTPTAAEELILQTKTGKLINVYSNHTIIQIPGKEPELFCIDINLTEQKIAEQKLKESEKLLNEAQKIAKIGNWNFDFMDDTLTWSDALYEVFDVDKSTFLETHGSFLSLIDEEYKAVVAETSKRTQETGEPFNIQYAITTPKGEKRIIEEFGYSEKNEKGEIIRLFGTAQDITEKSIYENTLRLANQRYEYVTKATTDIIFDFEISSNKVSFGTNVEKIIGPISKEQAISCDAREFSQRFKDADHMISQIQTTLNDPSIITWSTEQMIQTYEGTYLTFLNKSFILRDSQGKAYRVIGALQDISQQKDAENKKIIISEIRDIFNSKVQIHESLEKVLELICSQIDLDLGELWTTNIDGSLMNIIARYASTDEINEFHEASKSYTSFKKGEGFAGNVWKDNKIQIWTNIQDNKLFKRREFAKKAGLNTVLGIPLTINQEVIGVLIFGSSQQSETNLNYLRLLLQDLESSLSSELLRKKIELELKEIFEASPDILCITGYDGYFKKINPSATRLLGYTEQELLSRPFIEFTHPEDQNKTSTELSTIVDGKETMYFENRYITKSGQIIWLSWTSRANPIEQTIYAVAKNITKQKKLQQTLDSASELAKIGGWEMDVQTSEIQWTSTAKMIFEYPEDIVLEPEMIIARFPEPYQSEIRVLLDQCLTKGIPYEVESKIITDSGKEKWIRTIAKMEYEFEKPSKVVGSVQDVTTIKNFEESLKLLNKDLQIQSKKLAISNADLEQFAYIASHDLQEPLRMVSNFMSLLERKYGGQLDDKAKEYIDYAVNGAKKMRTIITDLLEFSRAGHYPEELEQVDINKVVADVLEMQNKLIEETEPTIEIQQLPTVSTLRLPMIQVFQNLINNSLKYAHAERHLKIRIAAEEKPKEWVFSVQDNGQGIPLEYLDKIFIIFQRANQTNGKSGSGLGLAIVKKILEKFDGRIWVESTMNEGSTFFFTIPK
ncbi:PAS domain S-box protein [Mongoliitalea daihaiensis]|uniref:PAS domain S-box protein n=1 Tax=Mongoliitalea daihaiensis TaxID=2782006 RepID=UPI001F3CB9D4|nr:PAS domain S-box protein [Mongoliitalea daihaiensis]UJP64492.1 PAS domain S-box protein [Mongoliitalea daihaiensis]